MEKVQWRCGTGARISEVIFSANRKERLAWQLLCPVPSREPDDYTNGATMFLHFAAVRPAVAE